MITNIMTVMYMRDAQAKAFDRISSRQREEAGAACGKAVPAPTPCSTCDGAREVPRPGSNGSAPCSGCCCVFCSNVTDTPPECRDCFLAEDDMQKRRSDL